MEGFQRWTIEIATDSYSIKNEGGRIMAFKRARTAQLKANYTIYIQHGTAMIWVEPHINMPFYLSLDIADPAIQGMTTPQPNKTYGTHGRRVNPHQVKHI